MMKANSRILTFLMIVTGFIFFLSNLLGVAGILLYAKARHFSALVTLNMYCFAWLWLLIMFLISLGLLLKIRWVIPAAIVISLYFSWFDMDSIYLYTSSSYTNFIFIDQWSSFLNISVIPLSIIANFLWFLELWQTKGRKAYADRNRFTDSTNRLIPQFLTLGWLVSLMSTLCCIWAAHYCYLNSHQVGLYVFMTFWVAFYFVALFCFSWAIIYRKTWAMYGLVVANTFFFFPAYLAVCIVFWFHLSGWEDILLLFSATVVCLCDFIGLKTYQHARREKILVRLAKHPITANRRKLLIARLLFWLLKAGGFAFVAYLLYQGYIHSEWLKQGIIYWLNPNHSW